MDRQYILDKIRYWENQLTQTEGSRVRTFRGYWNNYKPEYKDRESFHSQMRSRGRDLNGY